MTKKNPQKDLIWLRGISSFTASRIILTANNYRIFDYLDGRGKTPSDLSKKLSTDKRATELILNSLAGIGLLRKSRGYFRNAPVASKYLVKGRPGYQGDILRHYNTLWSNWSGLDRVFKTGRPSRKTSDHESFILGMHNLASLRAGMVLQSISLKGAKTLLDLGGGPGTYSMAFAKKAMDVTLMDYPATLKIAKRLIREAGLSKKIRLKHGDFTKDSLGNNYDIIFISQIFHAYGEKECLSILKKCFNALNPGGRIVIQEFYLEDNRTSPLFSAVFAINMLINTERGRTYTPREMSSWLKKAGCSFVSSKRLEDTVLVTGTKKRR